MKNKENVQLLQDQKSTAIQVLMDAGGIKSEVDQHIFTIHDARRWMNNQTLIYGKTECPCCNSHIQTYRRTISSSQVYWLVLLNKFSKGGLRYVDFKIMSNRLYEALGRNASDYPLISHWGLIECDPDQAGHYKITEKGKEFLAGTIQVPKYLYFTNNKVWKQSPEYISSHDTKNFDVTDLTKL